MRHSVALLYTSMNKEPLESPSSDQGPVEHNDECPQEESLEAERDAEAHSAQGYVEPTKPDSTGKPSMDLQEVLQDIKKEESPPGEAPLDWLEPLEEDDDVDNLSRNDHDEESVAGESERSESLAGSENAFKRNYQ